jgi:heme-degrading monooxygenase HmoA
VISVHRFTSDDAGFADEAAAALALLAARPGFLRGRVGRCTDDPDAWLVVTEWQDVGSYRRGMSAYEVKVGAWELLGRAVPEPSAYEVVRAADASPPRG